MMAQERLMMKHLGVITKSRDDALAQLAHLSPALHAHALKPDNAMYPITLKPITDTPPLNNY